MDQPITTMSNGGIYHTKDRPPSGAPKIRMKIKIVPSDSNHQKQYNLRNFLLIWVDTDLNQTEDDDQNTLKQLRAIVDDIKIYTQLHQCIDFLTTVNDMKMFLIVGHTLARQIVPLVHDIPHLYVIYILSCDVFKHEQWIKRWNKIKGVHTDMKTIYQSLQQVVKQYHQNSIAMTFLPVNETTSIENLEQLNTSFLYSQIFQQILLGIDCKEEFIKDFILFWRYHYLDNASMLSVIDEFERDYRPDLSIWWYTRCDFVYQMLNLAILRSEANIIFYFSCFLKNLNRQIEQLYRQQIDDYHGQSLIVYRGQSLSILDFEKLKKTKDGLIYFNNFLSTNRNKEVALVSAKNTLVQADTIGVLFKISINPSVSSIPFASIHEVSYDQTENEILFSMNSVFRVIGITEIEENSSLYEVELELIADDDEQFRDLMVFIEQKTEEYAGWKQLDQTREKTTSIYDTNTYKTVSVEFIFNANEMKQFQSKLKCVYGNSNECQQSISNFEKALEICKKTLPSHHLNFSIIYHNFATVYKNMKEYSKALSFLEKALEIKTNILPSHHPDLATLYNNMGVAYSNLKEYSKALASYEKGIVIYEKMLSSNHPQLAHFYDNIAAVYFDMQDYSKALSYYEKALEMKKTNIHLNQYDLVTSYTNIGVTYRQMNEHRKALSYHEKALEIQKENFPSNYNEMSSTYIDIASAYLQIKECGQVVLIYEELIEYAKKNLAANHPSLASFYRNLGFAYLSIEKHSKALSCFEKQLEIHQKYYPARHPVLASIYHAMGRAYFHMMNCSEALSFYEKALDIQKETLASNDSQLATSYSAIGEVYRNLKDYSKGLSFHEKALAIREAILPANDSELAASYSNTGEMYRYVGENLKAISHLEKALEIYKELLPSDHPNLAVFYNDLANLYQNTGMDSKAISFQEKSIAIMENTNPINHSVLAALYSQIASKYDNMGEYSKARTTKKKLGELIQNNASLQIMAIITNGSQTTEKDNIGKSIFEKKRRKKRQKNV